MDSAAQSYREAEQKLWREAGANPTEQFVRLPRHDVTVRIQEVGQGSPVLFVHGNPSAGSTWAPLVARLSGLRCLLVDRPGTGLSGAYTYDRKSIREFFETLVVDVLDALEIDQAHLVGSSSGSDFVLWAGARHQHRVLRSVHFGCPGFAPGIHIALSERLIAVPGLWRLAARMFPTSVNGMRYMMKHLGHGASLEAGGISQGVLEWFSALYKDTPTLYHELQGASIMFSLRGFQPWLLPTAEDFAAITSPSCFFWGEQDNYGGVSIGHRMAELMPNASVQALPEGGHLPWLDDPEKAAGVARKHLCAEEPAVSLSANASRSESAS